MSDPNFPSTDPRAQGLAAGSSGGSRGFMTVAISDRAAKDYSKALKAIEETTKLGGWAAMMQMAKQFADSTGLLAPYIRLFEVLDSMVAAETADSVALIFEEIFTKENMEEMREQTVLFGDMVKVVVQGMIDMRKEYKNFIIAADKFGVEAEAWRLAFWRSVDEWGEQQADSLNSIFSNLHEINVHWTNKIRGALGGGDVDEDDTWWNPFD